MMCWTCEIPAARFTFAGYLKKGFAAGGCAPNGDAIAANPAPPSDCKKRLRELEKRFVEGRTKREGLP